MKLKDLIEANVPLKRLTEKRFVSYKKMRELVKLRKAVEQEVEFYATEEKKAISLYAETDASGTSPQGYGGQGGFREGNHHTS